jgi:hypothetical protein
MAVKNIKRRELDANAIRVGGFYVNDEKGLVREVWREQDVFTVCWRSYWLDSGDPTGDGLACSKLHLSRWANREATKEEIERMNAEFGEVIDIAKSQDLMVKLIEYIPNDLLVAEAKRRGLLKDD